jgi:hypothetical protein
MPLPDDSSITWDAFQNQVILEDAEGVIPKLKIQSLTYLLVDIFLERETTAWPRVYVRFARHLPTIANWTLPNPR